MEKIREKLSGNSNILLSGKAIFCLVWTLGIIIGFIAVYMPHNSDEDIFRKDIGNTQEISELKSKIKEKYKININIVVVNNKITSKEIGEEALQKFDEAYGSDKNSAIIYIAIKDKKMSIRTGDNIRNILTAETCSNMIDSAKCPFRQQEYDEGIARMLRYFINNYGDKKSSGDNKLYSTGTYDSSHK